MPSSNKDELKPENTYKTKTSPEKLTPLAPNFAEQHYTQQVKLTIELGSDDVNQKASTRLVLRISVLAGKMMQMGAFLVMAFTLQMSA